MYLDDITLEIFPGEETYPVPVEFRVTEEKDSEYMVLSADKYCTLNFRITELSSCSIWYTRFLIEKKMRLRVSAQVPCTFLWAVWKNRFYYTIGNFDESQILTDYYNLYHLPEVQWEISFKQAGEYETFNVLFTKFDLEGWKSTHFFPDLQVFLNKVNLGETAFLSLEHRRLTSGLQKGIADMIRGPVEPADRQGFYEDKLMDLFFHMLRDMAKDDRSSQTTLRQLEIEKLYEMRDLILARPGTHYSLKKLAQVAGMNKSKLQTGFRQLFKTTVFSFIRDERMRMARKLLRETSHSIKDVAAEAGYKNLSNFTQAFTKYFGYPPSQAR